MKKTDFDPNELSGEGKLLAAGGALLLALLGVAAIVGAITNTHMPEKTQDTEKK